MTLPTESPQLQPKTLKDWLKGLTTEERNALRLAGIQPSYLYMVASGNRSASADYAEKVEVASRVIGENRPGAGIVLRGSISRTCAECPYYTSCAGRQDVGI